MSWTIRQTSHLCRSCDSSISSQNIQEQVKFALWNLALKIQTCTDLRNKDLEIFLVTEDVYKYWKLRMLGHHFSYDSFFPINKSVKKLWCHTFENSQISLKAIYPILLKNHAWKCKVTTTTTNIFTDTTFFRQTPPNIIQATGPKTLLNLFDEIAVQMAAAQILFLYKPIWSWMLTTQRTASKAAERNICSTASTHGMTEVRTLYWTLETKASFNILLLVLDSKSPYRGI